MNEKLNMYHSSNKSKCICKKMSKEKLKSEEYM